MEYSHPELQVFKWPEINASIIQLLRNNVHLVKIGFVDRILNFKCLKIVFNSKKKSTPFVPHKIFYSMNCLKYSSDSTIVITISGRYKVFKFLSFKLNISLYIYPISTHLTTHSPTHSLICPHNALVSHLKLVPGFLVFSLQQCFNKI